MRKFFFTCFLMVIHCALTMAANYEYVDLGLTSKTLWATCNVGASAPEDYGNFYAWGETTTKSSFTWTNYIHCGGTETTPYDIGSSIVGTSYDVATAVMGDDWCMPTLDQFNELVKECTFDLRSLNGVVGYKVDGPNGNYIFLPLAGYKCNSSHYVSTTEGYYWSGTSDIVNNENFKASALGLIRSPRTAKISYLRRRTGIPVRAVKKQAVEEPQPAEEQFVDLGLPSKTLWAKSNVGASVPEEYGNFYAWGETTTKNTFSWETYTLCGGTETTPYDIGSSIVGTSYDVATAVMGNDWCMPTLNQYDELVEQCTFDLRTLNGVVGYKITGPNGNYIFLPLCGYKYDSSYNFNTTRGYYWSGTSDVVNNEAFRASVLCMSTSPKDISTTILRRRTGIPVRAVKKQEVEEVPVVEPYVDLGLPSKTLWATSNVGASTPEGYGNFYAWGETKTKTSFTWTNYTHCDGTQTTPHNIGSSIVGTSYDVATAVMGDDWCMPTLAQYDELVKECTFDINTVNGVVGYKVTGPNGKSIFLPLAGYKYDSSYDFNTTRGYYWSGTSDVVNNEAFRASVMCMSTSPKDISTTTLRRRTGMPVRAVKKTEAPETPETPVQETKGEYVDLGLSVKWATYNLGASKVSEQGDLFSWGETSTKSKFTWGNYVYANGTSSSVMDIGKDISGTQYDAAKALWGEDWRMPTEEEFNELLEKCSFTSKTIDGVKGGLFTGPNGNSIFIPYAGCSYDGTTVGKNTRALYWTSTLTTSKQKATAFYITDNKPFMSYGYRRSGFSIRPVCSVKDPEDPETPEDPVVEPPASQETWTSEAVDLGLSVKWASCNFGAEGETDLGDMYAWGETKPKNDYTWANYIYANGSESSVVNIGSDISNTEYDPVAASQSSNGDDQWRMPTGAEIQELKNKCTFKETTKNGVKGMTVTGPNGNFIFLPYGGYMYEGQVVSKGTGGYYWSSTLHTTKSKAYTLNLKNSAVAYSSFYRRTGIYIRPVCGDGHGSGAVDPDPGYVGPGPGPILPDPYFSNQSLFDTDGIETIGVSSASGDIYTLSGVKVDASNLQPGVYVRNGKKFVVK